MNRKHACLAVLCAAIFGLCSCGNADVISSNILSADEKGNSVNTTTVSTTSDTNTAASSTTSTTVDDPPTDEYINFDSQVTFDVAVRNADQNLPPKIPSLPEKKEIEMKFDAETGTLTVSVSRQLVELYPRKITYIANEATKLDVVKVDNKVKHLIISEGGYRHLQFL